MLDPTDVLIDRIRDSLQIELSRERILPTKKALEFLGFSPAHWRRLRAQKLAPPPIMIGSRKQGWRVGTLIDWRDSRTQKAPVDESRRDPRMVLTSEPARA